MLIKTRDHSYDSPYGDLDFPPGNSSLCSFIRRQYVLDVIFFFGMILIVFRVPLGSNFMTLHSYIGSFDSCFFVFMPRPL